MPSQIQQTIPFLQSIRFYLVLLVCLIAIPFSGMIIYFGIENRNDTIEEMNREKRSLVLSLASQQEIIVAGAHQLLKTLSQLEDIQQKRVNQINQLLKNLLQNNAQYGNILVADPDGTVIASARPFTPPLSIADRKFYRDVIRTKQFSPGEYVIGKTALKPLFNFGFPVTAPDGAILAIIAVGIDLSYLDKTFKHFVLPKGSNFTIIDHKGIIIHRGMDAEKYVGKPILPNNFKVIIEGTEEGGYTSIGIDAVNRHYYFKKLYSEGQKEPYLYVTASIPENYIQETSQKQMLSYMAIFGLIFVVSLAGAFLIAKHMITSKAATLLVSIKDLGMGRLNRKVSDQVEGGEFGLLANAFDEMNANLQERERASLRAETQYHMIIQTALDGFLVVDTNGILLEANDAYCAMTGYSRDELCAMSLLDVEEAQSPEEIEHRITQIIRHGGAHFESKHRCKDGRIIELDISITYSPDNGGRFFCFLRDIAGRKTLEDQLRQSQKMEAVGQLAGGVAHDFNNILTVISGYSSLMQMDGSLSDEQKKRVDEIASSAERAAQLTHGLLAFSRKQPLIMKYENLNDIVQHVHKFLARIIGEDITFQSSCCGTELQIVADRGQIEQVLINLATNARDAMAGGGVFTVKSDRAVLDSSFKDSHNYDVPPGNYALLTVSDTGTGISKEHIDHIFEPFFTTKEVGKGTGLGMAIIYGIVKQHNGFINVYSESGHGTTFRIYLPMDEKTNDFQTTKAEPVAPAGGNETILVAEDEPNVRVLIAEVLENHGYNVVLAEDGVDAVEKFKVHQDIIRLILMDMIMPKKNGKEAYEEISCIKPGVKLLFSSGYTADFIKSRGVSEDTLELIMKPLQPIELLRRVREMLDK